MKTSILWIFAALVIPLSSCSNSKKQTLEAEVKEEKKPAEVVSDFLSIEVLKGEPKSEIRRIDPTNPPTIIDISGQIESKDLNLSELMPEANFIKLQHPKSNEGKSFIIKTAAMPIPIPSPKKNVTPPTFFVRLAKDIPFLTFLSVVPYKDWILIGNLSGLFCYTKDGKHLYTLLESDEFNDAGQSESLDIDTNKAKNILCGYSVKDDICAFVSATQGKATLHLFDLNGGTEIYRKTMPMGKSVLLSGKHKTLLNYSYDVRAKESLPFMYTLTANNDTISSFLNKNTITDMSRMSTFHNPGEPSLYNYKERLYVRQQGNDTIYRFRSEYEINPANIFKTGNYKATIQDIIKGNIKEKRSIDKVVETDRLLLFSLRGSDAVFYYDKVAKEVYESSQIFSNEDTKALPLSFKGLYGNEKMVYGVYTKIDIDSFAKNEQLLGKYAHVDKWKNELKDGEILLMLME